LLLFSLPFFFFLQYWGLSSEPSPWPAPPAFFVMIGSHKLFAWAIFEPQFSWSLPPE
jgi:hypothetical protein